MRGIEGVYVANVTPFKDDGSLDVDIGAYLEHVSWLAEMGVRGIVPFGTNGEGPSVTLGEKLWVLEALFGRGFPIQVIPAVMQNNLPETLQMLRVLEDYPATAVLILPPYYFKPVEPEGMVRFYEMVLAATDHTAIIYHIPKYAVPVPAGVVQDLPVWGVKDSGGEEGYAEAVLEGGKGVLLGTEETSGGDSVRGPRVLSPPSPTSSPKRCSNCTKSVGRATRPEAWSSPRGSRRHGR